MISFGGETYREGARERLNDARILFEAKSFSASVYLAGRSVEGWLRCLIWTSDHQIQSGRKSLETGHDLRKLLKCVRSLGLLRVRGRDDVFESEVQRIGRLWFNNLRFASNKRLESAWQEIGEIQRRRTLKTAAEDFLNACFVIDKRCEVLYDQNKKIRA